MSVLETVSLYTKEDRKPSPTDRLVLQAIDRQSGLTVTYSGGRPIVRLGDGTGLYRFANFNLPRAIRSGWLRPDPTEPTPPLGMYAQRYLVAPEFRSIEEGR